LAVAKDRQRALIAALPARYSRNPFASKSSDSWDSIDGPLASGDRASGASSKPQSSKGPGKSAKEQDDGRRWEMLQQLPPGVVATPNPLNPPDPSDRSTPADSTDLNSLAGDSQSPGSSQGSPTNGGSRIGKPGDDDSQTTGGSSSETNGSASQGSVMASSSSGQNASSRFSSASSGSAQGTSNSGQTAQEAELEQAIKEQAMKAKSQATSKGVSSSPSKPSGAESELKPISMSAGKDWATTRMDNKSTPVSRPIRIIALQDRWLMCREGQDWKYDAEILLDQGPQGASEQLQQAIRDRVESWGLSLPGGYWVPSLTVQTAADADQSVGRLQRLLEGSGVVIRTEPLVTPNSRK
jgi:hypothetical protein